MNRPIMDWGAEAEKSMGGYTLLPTGTYKVLITDWEEGASKTKGSPQIMWKAEVLADGGSGEHVGATAVDYTYLTPTSLWRLAKFVTATGLIITNLPKMEVGGPAFKRVMDACKGRMVYWSIKKEVFEGKDTNKVVDYMMDAEQPRADLVSIGDMENDVPKFVK